MAPDVQSLIYGLMPWLSAPVADEPDGGRSPSVSRSGAVRRTRSPSLSLFWSQHLSVYHFLELHSLTFTSDPKCRPRISDPPATLGPAIYCISARSLRVWKAGEWKVLRDFDSSDLLVSFPLRDSVCYFETVLSE